MKVNFGATHYTRETGKLPHLPVINMIAEETPTEEGVSLIPRKGLSEDYEVGDGPVRCIYSDTGVLNGNTFVVSGNKLYEDGTEVGQIDGNGHVSIAGYEDKIFITAGVYLYYYDGLTLTPADSSTTSALKVLIAKSRAVVIKDEGQTFMWSDVLGTTFDGLAFAEAENSPDQLKDAVFVGDVLYLFGSRTIEPWPVYEDDDAPFQPLSGRVFETGIRDTGCVTHYKSTFAWVTDDNEVCVSTPDNVISYPGLQRKIKDSDTVSVWSYIDDGQEFLAITLTDETWIFCPLSQTWSVFLSDGQDNWLARCYHQGAFGSSVDGKVLVFNDTDTDLDGPIERRFRAWMPVSSGGMIINNVLLRTNPGWTEDPEDDPQIEMRRSKDGGYTWSSWRSRSLGTQGNYRTRVEWDCLGMFGRPGMLLEFRVVDAVTFRVSEVLVNEPKGGI